MTRHRYQYAVLRYQHSFGSGESINIGVFFWAPERRGLKFFINPKIRRLRCVFGPEFSEGLYHEITKDLERRAALLAEDLSAQQGGLFTTAITSLEQFIFDLVAQNASCLQWSEIFGGVTGDLERRFLQLQNEYVLRFDPEASREQRREQRKDADVWRSLRKKLESRGIFEHVQQNVELRGRFSHHNFRMGWVNGKQHVLAPISFDMAEPAFIVNKALRWSGILTDLRDTDFRFYGAVAPPASDRFSDEYRTALKLLRDAPHVDAIVPEEEFDSLLPKIEQTVLSVH
ncbi:DUF3037 domain-containing protein [Nannocystis pusilla]|uniref:DUF3037 domain-containing protein n=1 Tax=Nannocystis pusilla TaxID=889268 RepID=UPI003DA3E9AD